jgi:Skp family chaperone for outer membrane proteins
MNRWITPLVAAALGAAALFGSTTPTRAAAQDRPVRVAVVNIPRVFDSIQETQDAKVRLSQDRQRLATEQKQKLEQLQSIKNEGGNFRRGSDQYAEWRQRYVRAQIQQQAWEATAKQEMDWRVKLQTRETFEKIATAVSEYATSNQIDLVLSDHQPVITDEELEKVPAEQVGALVDRRRVIYASKNADISDAIIASLDAKYKAGGGAAPAPAAAIGQNQGNDAGNANTAGANLRGNEQPAPQQQPQQQRRQGNR